MAEVPGFCLLVAYDGSTPTLLAWGEVEIHLPRDPGPVSPAQQITWLEGRVPDLDGLRITGVGASLADLDADPRSAAPASSEAVRRVQAAAATPSQAATQPIAKPSDWTGAAEHTPPAGTVARDSPAEPPQPTFEAVRLGDEPSELTDVPPPLRMAGDALQHESALVDGSYALAGTSTTHGPDTASRRISTRSGTGVSAPRSALGVLIFDDGTAFSVDLNLPGGREVPLVGNIIQSPLLRVTCTSTLWDCMTCWALAARSLSAMVTRLKTSPLHRTVRNSFVGSGRRPFLRIAPRVITSAFASSIRGPILVELPNGLLWTDPDDSREGN